MSEVKQYWIAPMPKAQKTCKYLLIPANEQEPIQELELEQPAGEELSIFLDTIKLHYRKVTGGIENVAAKVKLVKDEMKKQGAKTYNNLGPETLKAMGKSQMVSNIPLMLRNKSGAAVGWRGLEQIYMYVDDYGKLNHYPPNERARQLLNEVGAKHNGPVWGDCFISRYYDDDADVFIRMDFSMADLNKSAPWRHFAIRRSFRDKEFPCLLQKQIKWTQEDDEVLMIIPHESKKLNAKKVDIKFSCNKIGVMIEGELIVERELGGRIDPEESTWQLERGKGLEVTLCKSGKADWDFLLM